MNTALPLHPHSLVGVGRGWGVLAPWILIIVPKKVVFQCQGVKTKFHHFGPLLEKFGKIP